MLLIQSASNAPAINLGLEESILRQSSEEAILIYRNNRSIICGKHQNLMAEHNPLFCHVNAIPVFRRISGGGTVYHDEGNVNFSFILNKDYGKQVDFKFHTQPVIKYLETLSLPAFFGSKNDIRIGEFKVSGNAEHVYKDRVLHHGTLLYDTDLRVLSEALRPTGAKYTGHWVKSNPSEVVNIRTLIQNPASVSDFAAGLISFLKSWFNIDTISDGNEILWKSAQERANTKYSQPSWIFGYSPKYEYFKEVGNHKLEMLVEQGRIQKALLTTSQKNQVRTQTLETLHGQWHSPAILDELSSGDLILSPEDMRNLLF